MGTGRKREKGGGNREELDCQKEIAEEVSQIQINRQATEMGIRGNPGKLGGKK